MPKVSDYPAELALRVDNLGKCYQIYDKPQHRLWQGLFRGRKTFYREFWALKGISVDIRKGETVGIIGRNGSGKSTLLQLIAGTLQPTMGAVQVNGRVAALLELGSGFNPEFTGRENVFLNGAVLGIPFEEMQKRIEAVAAFADIGEFLDQPVKTYSSGMVLRLAFAVSVNVEPDILIVDEALSVGDVAFQFKCLQRLEELTQAGVTLLFVSHSMEMVKTFCQRAIYLKHGEPYAMGPPEELAELYLMDVRDEQTRNLSADRSVKPKPVLQEAGGISFGTEQGSILAAGFEGDRPFASIFYGDELKGYVSVEYNSSVSRPYLVLIIQDRKGLNIGGAGMFLPSGAGEGRQHSHLFFHFPVTFFSGRYFITFRLEDRRSKEIKFLIEKQVGALSFEVMPLGKELTVGMVDLGVQWCGADH